VGIQIVSDPSTRCVASCLVVNITTRTLRNGVKMGKPTLDQFSIKLNQKRRVRMEKYMILLVSLPAVSVILVTLVNLFYNPVGTIQGLYKFILKLNRRMEK